MTDANEIEREIEWVELSNGRRISAQVLICPECRTLDLGTTVDGDVAQCPCGHSWPLRFD